MSLQGPLRVAFFSDLTGESSVAAYCSRLLIPLLARNHSLELFSTSFDVEYLGVPHFHHLKAYQRHREHPFDLFFYQLEDGKRSRFVRSSCGIIPGITWFHDLFFEDLGSEATHTSPWEHSIKQYYDPALAFSDRAIAPHQLWPRAFRELSVSPICLFSSKWSLSEAETMLSARVECDGMSHRRELLSIPIEPFSPPPIPSNETLHVATMAGVGHEGRPHKFLAALRALKTPWKLRWILEPSERATAEVLLREFGVGENVELCYGRSMAAWKTALGSAHVALHLRSTSFGHLAPYLQLSLASGRLTVVSDLAQGEDLPDNVAVKITPGISEAAQLLAVLEQAASLDIAALTAQARSFVSQEHNAARIASALSTTWSHYASALASPMKRWQSLYSNARTALLNEVRSLADGESEAISPYSQVVSPVLSDLFPE